MAFDSKRGFRDLPLELPCGKCIGCKQNKARMWTIRCMHEAQMHKDNCFITLTYDQDHVPFDGSLRKAHLQEFFGRLRHAKGRFRYFACGEYGERTYRPHYHALLFGCDFPDATLAIEDGKKRWYSKTLDDTWKMGRTQVGRLERGSAAYVAQYCVKKQFDDYNPDQYRRVALDGTRYSVASEFITMSRRPGLGSSWFEKFHTDVFPHDNVVLDGSKYKVPRFYVDRLAEVDRKWYRARQIRRDRKQDQRHRTPKRMRTRENVAEARQQMFDRSGSF